MPKIVKICCIYVWLCFKVIEILNDVKCEIIKFLDCDYNDPVACFYSARSLFLQCQIFINVYSARSLFSQCQIFIFTVLILKSLVSALQRTPVGEKGCDRGLTEDWLLTATSVTTILTFSLTVASP